MRVAAILITAALTLFAILEFSSGEWHWHGPAQRRQAAIVDGYNARRHRKEAVSKETNDSQSESEPLHPIEDVVSASTLNEFPKLYQDKYVEFVGWQNALVENASSVEAESSQPLSLPADCKFVLHFLGANGANAFGCAESVPKYLLNPFGAASEENIGLYCKVEAVTAIGIFLTHCKLSPSEYMKMKEKEYELETGRPSR
jgi:hypothetical protein